MKIFEYIHKLLKKKWNREDINNLIGPYKRAYISYAHNNRIRLGGSSGGSATAILAYALDTGLIDGALVCRTFVQNNNKVRTKFYIASNTEELLLSQGSHYVQTDFIPDALELIDNFHGKLAITGLPCDLTAIKKRLLNRNSRKIIFTIGLFCGHNSQYELIDNIIRKLSPNKDSILDNFRFRTGLWRGYSLARFDQNQIIEKTSSYYNLYQNLYFFCQKKCLYCFDHFAYNADISLGDIWSYNLKTRNIKYNSIICKNKKAIDIISSANKNKYLNIFSADIEDILDGQARGAPTHNNTSAKSRAGKFFKMNIPDIHKKKVKIRHYIIAWLILFNYKWSMSKRYSSLIFKLPRSFLKLYLFFIKGLESLK